MCLPLREAIGRTIGVKRIFRASCVAQADWTTTIVMQYNSTIVLFCDGRGGR
jgi:hypothetical protein